MSANTNGGAGGLYPDANVRTKCREIVTPEFRISFPSLFKPEAREGQEPKYKITMLFPAAAAPALEPLYQRCREAIAAKWPDMASRPKNIRNPFRSGDEKAHLAGYPGTIFATAVARVDNKPRVVGPDHADIIDPGKVYAGSYARAVLEIYAYSRNGNNGVGIGVVMVQWLRDGEPFGRAYGSPEDYFGGPAVAQAAPTGKPPLLDTF